MPKAEKEATVKELTEKLEGSAGCILTDYRGLDVKAITELRRKLGEQGIDYKVVKNTLFKIAASGLGLPDLEGVLAGPTAIAFSKGDPTICAKLISEFAREHKELQIKGGILGRSILDAPSVATLATLPPREVLLGRVLGAMQGPISGLVGVLSGTIRSLVYVLEAVRKQKEGATSQEA